MGFVVVLPKKIALPLARCMVSRTATAACLTERRAFSSQMQGKMLRPTENLFGKPIIARCAPAFNYTLCSRAIATSEKKKDSLSIHHDDVSSKLINTPVDTNYVGRKDWVSRGVDQEDEDYDTWGYYYCLFIGIIMLCVVPTWYITYAANLTAINPDWLMREAYLELHRREKYGLPLVDPDFVARENIVLPTEEELKDFVILI